MKPDSLYLIHHQNGHPNPDHHKNFPFGTDSTQNFSYPTSHKNQGYTVEQKVPVLDFGMAHNMN